MLHFDYNELFQSLSADDRHKGQALRVPRCVRGARKGEIAWIVLYLCNKNDTSVALNVRGFIPILHARSTVFGPFVRSFTPFEDGCLWYVQEFEVVLPLNVRAFSIMCGESSLRMSWQERNQLLDMHYEEIAHAATDTSYPEWFLTHQRTSVIDAPPLGPLMSIVSPVYRTPPAFLTKMIDSVLEQSYKNWELVIVNASPDDSDVGRVLNSYNDERIIIVENPENNGISGNTNVGIAATRGSYVSFLDHDDVVEPSALSYMVKAINEAEERIDLLYCDEDSIDEREVPCLPLFKPSLNPDLLYSNNYVVHWLTVSREVLDAVERSSRNVDGAQDYDLTLKTLELSHNIVRIPHVLYHWRIHSGSTNMNPDSKPYARRAGAKAIEDHFARRELQATVSLEEAPFTYKTVFDVPCDGNSSIVCLVNATLPSEALRRAAAEYERRTNSLCVIVQLNEDTPEQVERMIASSEEHLVLFCPDSLGQIDADSLMVMAGYFQRDKVAAVSPKMIRLDGLTDYAGACVCPDGDVMYLNRFLPSSDGGHVGRTQRPYDGFVLNSRCFMIRKELLQELLAKNAFVGFSWWHLGLFAECFERGLFCVYTPFACVYDTQYKSLLDFGLEGFAHEDRVMFAQQYGDSFRAGDPSHNPNFDPYSPFYRLRRP